MTVVPGDGLNVAAELAGLRGEMSTGFAEIKGQLALISDRQSETVKDISKLSNDLEKLDTRVTALEERRWPLGPIVAVSGVVAALAAGLAVFFGQ